MSCFEAFNNLCKRVICPKRHAFNQKDLIQRKLTKLSPNHRIQVQEITILNNQGVSLSAIGFIHDVQNYNNILYLHGNGGTKLECLQFLEKQNIGKLENFNLFAFDFQGCGMSQGEYLTYGKKEFQDIKCVISYLKTNLKLQRKFSIWGRSMGASLGLMVTCLQPQLVSCLVLDTPFRRLDKVIFNVASETAPKVPTMLLDIFLMMMQCKIKGLCGQDVFKQDFQLYLNKMQQENSSIPIFFSYSSNDKIVKEEDVKQLFQSFKGTKTVLEIKVHHHQDRPQELIHKGLQFLSKNGMEIPSTKRSKTIKSSQISQRQKVTKNVQNVRKRRSIKNNSFQT